MKKGCGFSQIDEEILSRLQQDYHVVVLNPKLGDINEQIRQEVVDADGMIELVVCSMKVIFLLPKN